MRKWFSTLFALPLIAGCVSTGSTDPPEAHVERKPTPHLSALEYAKLREIDRLGRFSQASAYCRTQKYTEEAISLTIGQGHKSIETVTQLFIQGLHKAVQEVGEDGLPKCSILWQGPAGFNFKELVFYQYVGGEKAVQIWEIEWTGGGSAFIAEIVNISVA